MNGRTHLAEGACHVAVNEDMTAPTTMRGGQGSRLLLAASPSHRDTCCSIDHHVQDIHQAQSATTNRRHLLFLFFFFGTRRSRTSIRNDSEVSWRKVEGGEIKKNDTQTRVKRKSKKEREKNERLPHRNRQRKPAQGKNKKRALGKSREAFAAL